MWNDGKPALESCVKRIINEVKHSVEPALTVSELDTHCINQGGTAESSVPFRER